MCFARGTFGYSAIDCRSRSVHLAVKDDETEKSAIAFLCEAAASFPFRLTHVLTDNGSCFTPAFAKACVALGAQYCHTKPRTPQTNGGVAEGSTCVSRWNSNGGIMARRRCPDYHAPHFAGKIAAVTRMALTEIRS